MERVDWDFNIENQQKKSIGRSASHRKTKKKGCTLPSDHLTPAQKRKLNGEVICVNFNKPCRWAEFKLLSKDIQEKYLNSLHERFNAGRGDIAKMFGVDPSTFKKFVEVSGLNIFPACKGSRLEDPDGWENFKRGLLTTPEEKEEEQKAIYDEAVEVLSLGNKDDTDTFSIFHTEFKGLKNLETLVQIVKNLPFEEDVLIRLEIFKPAERFRPVYRDL